MGFLPVLLRRTGAGAASRAGSLSAPAAARPVFGLAARPAFSGVRPYGCQGSRSSHLPFVKSGIAIGMPPRATLCSLRAVTLIQAAAS